MSENNKEGSEKRYLFIISSENDYQREIMEFLLRNYAKNGEYFNYLQVTGSIYPMLIHGIDDFNYHHNLKYDKLRSNLISQCFYLIDENRLNQIVVVSEPECKLYNKFISSEMTAIDKFPSQKEAFYKAIEMLGNHLKSFKYKVTLEAWYMDIADSALEGYKDIIFHEYFSDKISHSFLKI